MVDVVLSKRRRQMNYHLVYLVRSPSRSFFVFLGVGSSIALISSSGSCSSLFRLIKALVVPYMDGLPSASRCPRIKCALQQRTHNVLANADPGAESPSLPAAYRRPGQRLRATPGYSVAAFLPTNGLPRTEVADAFGSDTQMTLLQRNARSGKLCSVSQRRAYLLAPFFFVRLTTLNRRNKLSTVNQTLRGQN